MTKTENQKRELETEVIALRVKASFKAKLVALAEADKRKLGDFIHLKLEECIH